MPAFQRAVLFDGPHRITASAQTATTLYVGYDNNTVASFALLDAAATLKFELQLQNTADAVQAVSSAGATGVAAVAVKPTENSVAVMYTVPPDKAAAAAGMLYDFELQPLVEPSINNVFAYGANITSARHLGYADADAEEHAVIVTTADKHGRCAAVVTNVKTPSTNGVDGYTYASHDLLQGEMCHDVAFAVDLQVGAVASAMNVVHVVAMSWNTDKTPNPTLRGPIWLQGTKSTTMVRYSPDSALLLVGGEWSTAATEPNRLYYALYNVSSFATDLARLEKTPTLVVTYPYAAGSSSSSSSVPPAITAAFSPDSKKFAIMHNSSTLQVFDATYTGEARTLNVAPQGIATPNSTIKDKSAGTQAVEITVTTLGEHYLNEGDTFAFENLRVAGGLESIGSLLLNVFTDNEDPKRSVKTVVNATQFTYLQIVDLPDPGETCNSGCIPHGTKLHDKANGRGKCCSAGETRLHACHSPAYWSCGPELPDGRMLTYEDRGGESGTTMQVDTPLGRPTPSTIYALDPGVAEKSDNQVVDMHWRTEETNAAAPVILVVYAHAVARIALL